MNKIHYYSEVATENQLLAGESPDDAIAAVSDDSHSINRRTMICCHDNC